MSRAPGPSGMVDIKSGGIHMLQVNLNDPCAPGSYSYQMHMEEAKKHEKDPSYIGPLDRELPKRKTESAFERRKSRSIEHHVKWKEPDPEMGEDPFENAQPIKGRKSGSSEVKSGSKEEILGAKEQPKEMDQKELEEAFEESESKPPDEAQEEGPEITKEPRLGPGQPEEEGGLKGGAEAKPKKNAKKDPKDPKKNPKVPLRAKRREEEPRTHRDFEFADGKSDPQFRKVVQIDPEDRVRRIGRYDRPQSWTIIIAAGLIVFLIIGVIHSFPPFINHVMDVFGMGVIEVIAVGCLTYAIIIAFAPISAIIIVILGARIVTMFGLCLFFLGLLLDSLCIHVAVFYISHLILMGFGGSLAYTAAVSIARVNLQVSLTIISVSAMLGTIFFYWIGTFLLTHILYRWVMLIFALLTLLACGVAMFFPRRCDFPMEGVPWRRKVCKKKPRRNLPRECVDEYRKFDHYGEDDCDPVTGKRRPPAYICVMSCDCSVCGDLSFLLWGLLVFIAVMAFLVPYIFLSSFAYDLGHDEKSLVFGIALFCAASIIARIILINYNDHTFFLSRLLFQLALILSGVLYIVLIYATTYGWLLLTASVLGLTEGILVIVIPRLTLLTVPKDYIISSWGFILLFMAVGLVFGPMLVIIIKACTGAYYVGFMAIGVLQILGGIIALILPDEENFLEDDDEECSSSEDEKENHKNQLPKNPRKWTQAERVHYLRDVQNEEEKAHEVDLERRRNSDYYRELGNRMAYYKSRGSRNRRRSLGFSYIEKMRRRSSLRESVERSGSGIQGSDRLGSKTGRNSRSGKLNAERTPRSVGGSGSFGVVGDKRSGLGSQKSRNADTRRKSALEEEVDRILSRGKSQTLEEYGRRRSIAQDELLASVREFQEGIKEEHSGLDPEYTSRGDYIRNRDRSGERRNEDVESDGEGGGGAGGKRSIRPGNLKRKYGVYCSPQERKLKSYLKNCPICQKIGCVPGCCNSGCIPGELAGLSYCDTDISQIPTFSSRNTDIDTEFGNGKLC